MSGGVEETKSDPVPVSAAAAPSVPTAASTDATAAVSVPISTSDAAADSGSGSGSGSSSSGFHFTPDSTEPPFRCLDDAAVKEALKTWDLETLTTFKRFRFGQRFQLESADAFLRDFFNSADVRAALPVYSSARAPAHLTGTVAAVDMDRLRTTVLNMEFFDRCQESDLVTESGYIRKTYDNTVDGVQVADLLRDMLINADSDNAELFSEEDRQEFLFQLFQTLCIGGSMCQYEDSWDRYLAVAKAFYKDLVSVHKTDGGKLVVSSVVFAVNKLDCDTPLFPHDNPHNRCLVSVDPARRTVSVFYSAFIPFW